MTDRPKLRNRPMTMTMAVYQTSSLSVRRLWFTVWGWTGFCEVAWLGDGTT